MIRTLVLAAALLCGGALYAPALAQTAAVPPPMGTLAQTQTVTAGAGIQFTGLAGNAAYAMQCHALQVATNAVHLQLEVGEGATPIWQTAGSYFVTGSTMNSQATNAWTTNYGGETQTAVLLDWSGAIVSNGASELNLVELHFADLASAGFKPIQFHTTYMNTSTHLQNTLGVGEWRGDTNPITAIRLRASSGNISGTCNLYQLSGN